MVGGSRWLDPLALLRHLFPALSLTTLAIEVMLSAWLPPRSKASGSLWILRKPYPRAVSALPTAPTPGKEKVKV